MSLVSPPGSFTDRSQPSKGRAQTGRTCCTGQAVGPPCSSGVRGGGSWVPGPLTLQLLVHNSQALLKGSLCLQQGIL